MSFRSSITIVASPRPRVGKTLLARLLTDFHRHEGRDVAAFDLNAGAGTLAQFLPTYATPSAIGDIKGEMALFDTLVAGDDARKVVDLGHESFEAFFALAQRIGFIEETRRRGVAVAILFLLTPDATSVNAYRDLRRRFPGARLAPTHNEMLGTAQYRDRYALAGSGEVVTRLPVLAPALRKYVETPPFSFADADMASATEIPLEAHIELQRWLRRVYPEFRELDLRILLSDLQSAIELKQ
jgi:hypothetical protein